MIIPFFTAFEFLESCLARIPDRSADAGIPDWFAMRTHQGSVRAENQDRVLTACWREADQTAWVLAVADGIGGGHAGSEAASMTLSAFVAALLEFQEGALAKRLERACARSNQTLNERWRGKEGSTLSAILVRGEEHAWVNVGDSRIYAIDPQGGVVPLTKDDALPLGAGLVQFIGIGKGLEPHTGEFPDQYHHTLVTTDGVHQYVAPLLPSLVRTATSASMLVDRLIHLSLWCGGEDNATVAMAALHGTAPSSPPACEVWTPGQHHRLVLASVVASNVITQDKSHKSTAPQRTRRKGKAAISDRPQTELYKEGSSNPLHTSSESQTPHEGAPSRPAKRPDILMTIESDQAVVDVPLPHEPEGS